MIGYPYDSEEDVFEDTDFQKKMMKLSLQELQQRNIIKKKQMGTTKKDEEEKQSESDKNGPTGQQALKLEKTASAQQEEDDMQIKRL